MDPLRGNLDRGREGRSCEDTWGRQPSTNQERGLERNPPCRHLDLGLPACRILERTNVCLRHPVYSASLRQPELTPQMLKLQNAPGRPSSPQRHGRPRPGVRAGAGEALRSLSAVSCANHLPTGGLGSHVEYAPGKTSLDSVQDGTQ